MISALDSPALMYSYRMAESVRSPGCSVGHSPHSLDVAGMDSSAVSPSSLARAGACLNVVSIFNRVGLVGAPLAAGHIVKYSNGA